MTMSIYLLLPFDNEFTNFTQHGIFLPVFFYKIAFSGEKENQTQYFYLNQDVIELSQKQIFRKATVVKLQQGEQELVPESKK